MDLRRMLKMCHRDQWSAEDLDLSHPPRPMTRAEEIAVCQYFTNMAGIERLAGALFAEQRKRTDDPTLEEIFRTFEVDEIRHSRVAKMLADHYNVHHYQRYEPNPHLVKFAPAFVEAIKHLTPEIANVYITTGEIVLDVALLRSLNDYVNDPVSNSAMTLINRDESRHIAVDFHMIEYYSSDGYQEDLQQLPRRSVSELVRGWSALMKMLFHARPFFKAVFFEPMEIVDPSGARLREAFKRIQLVATKPQSRRRPFVRFILGLQAMFNHPVFGLLFGRLIVRIVGVDPDVMRQLYDEDEERQARHSSYDALANETLAAKFAC